MLHINITWYFYWWWNTNPTCVSVSILTFLGMVIVNKVPHYRVTKLEPHTTDTQVRSGQLQFCHPNSEAPIIARKAIPKLTEMDKLPVLNTSASVPVKSHAPD